MGEPGTEEVDRNQALRQMVQHLNELLAGPRDSSPGAGRVWRVELSRPSNCSACSRRRLRQERGQTANPPARPRLACTGPPG